MTVKQLKNILAQLPEEKEIYLDTITDCTAQEVYETEGDDVIYITDDAESSIDYCEHQGKNRIFLADGSICYYEFNE